MPSRRPEKSCFDRCCSLSVLSGSLDSTTVPVGREQPPIEDSSHHPPCRLWTKLPPHPRRPDTSINMAYGINTEKHRHLVRLIDFCEYDGFDAPLLAPDGPPTGCHRPTPAKKAKACCGSRQRGAQPVPSRISGPRRSNLGPCPEYPRVPHLLPPPQGGASNSCPLQNPSQSP